MLATASVILAILPIFSDGTNGAGNSLIQQCKVELAAARFDKAQTMLESALQSQPNNTQVRLMLGKTHLERANRMPVTTQEEWDRAAADYEKAERLFREVIEAESEHAEAWALLGRTLVQLGDSQQAIATLYHAQSFQPNSLRLMLDLADALLMSRDYSLQNNMYEQADTRLTEAEEVLERALGQLSLHADILKRYADVKQARGEPEVALESYRRAITLKPNDTTMHDAFIAAVEANKQFDESVSFYEGLVDEPSLAKWYGAVTHELKGHVAYNADQDYEAAAEEYATAESLFFESSKKNPDYSKAAHSRVPFLRSYRGFALAKAGNLEQAESALFSALDRSPGLTNAIEGLTTLMDAYWTKMGGEEATKDDFDKIRAFASRVCVVNPNDADAWNNYGFFAREAGKYEESYQAYRRAMNLAPDNARIINDTALILVYHLGRDLDLAESWLWEARDIAQEELADANDQASVAAHQETVGDAYVNLVTMYYNHTKEMDKAKECLELLKAEYPHRDEIGFWHKRLLPDEPEWVSPDSNETPPPILTDDSTDTDEEEAADG